MSQADRIDPSARSRRRRIQPQGLDWLWLALALAFGIAISSQRIVVAPGFELYFGPFCFMLTFMVFGRNAALVVCALVLAPSYFWWGHFYTIGLGLLFVVLLPRLMHWTGSLTFAALAYSMTVGLLASFVLMQIHYEAPAIITGITFARKVLNDVSQAALVELISSVLAMKGNPMRLVIRRRVPLMQLLQSFTGFTIAVSGLILFVGQSNSFPRHVEQFQSELRIQMLLMVHEEPNPAEAYDGLRGLLNVPTSSGNVPVIISQEKARFTESDMAQLGCSRIDAGGPLVGPDDRDTFAYWLSACQVGSGQVHDLAFHYLFTTRHVAYAEYNRLLLQMTWPTGLLILAGLLHFFVTRLLNRTVGVWRRVIHAFGSPTLHQPRGQLFAEFEEPIRQFVATNNAYVRVIAERERLTEAVDELRRGIDLQLASEIHFNPESRVLRYESVSLTDAGREVATIIHPHDSLAMSGAMGLSEALVEFRQEGADAADWFMLLARDPLPDGGWRSGCILRLRDAKVVHDSMMQQARLMNLGGMASALSHELKQPLFTISLAAENGSFLSEAVEAPGMEKVRSKFDRILEQVDRARDIIGRISHYARVEDKTVDAFNLEDAIRASIGFLRPLFVQEDVRVQLMNSAGRKTEVQASRVGVEQIVVNALQNAVDAIGKRREGDDKRPGEIRIAISPTETGLRVSIADNGSGLAEAVENSAFDPFVTTKADGKGTGLGLYISRQIMMEMGGSIMIGAAPGPEPGAMLSLDIPESVIAQGTAEDSTAKPLDKTGAEAEIAE
jgi:two-component system, NtrC family, C4-dicarboxylate transport sensor histidine kinase DctB